MDDQEWLHRKIEKIIDKSIVTNHDDSHKSHIFYSIEDDCPAFAYNQRLQPFLKTYLETVNEMEGRSIKGEMAGGAGDVNYMCGKSTLVLDGLGALGSGMHTRTESIDLPSLCSRSEALQRLLKLATERLS